MADLKDFKVGDLISGISVYTDSEEDEIYLILQQNFMPYAEEPYHRGARLLCSDGTITYAIYTWNYTFTLASRGKDK